MNFDLFISNSRIFFDHLKVRAVKGTDGLNMSVCYEASVLDCSHVRGFDSLPAIL